MGEKMWALLALAAGVVVGANWGKIKKHSAPVCVETGNAIVKGCNATGRALAKGWKSTGGAVVGLFAKKKRKAAAPATALKKAPVRRGRKPGRRTVPVPA